MAVARFRASRFVVVIGVQIVIPLVVNSPGWAWCQETKGEVNPNTGATMTTTGNRRTVSDGKPYVDVPDTVSPEWREYLAKMPSPAQRPVPPALDDLAGWKQYQAAREKERMPDAEAAVKKFEPTIAEKELGGVPVLEITPKGWRDNGKLLVYVHGGAYALFSARSTLNNSAYVADSTGLRVISVDYTLAPQAKWEQVTDQAVAVMEALKLAGHSWKDIAIYGDSAGGGLAAGAVLKMRDKGLGMPAAVVLWSPWSDITETGDTYTTLKQAEPNYLYATFLKPCADAYADSQDQKNPYVSPVYGDYSKGFPPTLIQGGTKEIFLSNFIRQYQAIDVAGGAATLDLFEGMIHVFQPRLPDSPESKLALKKMKSFLNDHLGD
jgi:acetyl esterase/lipase